MMRFLFITDTPELALFAEACGVERIFVDLETLGKKERQQGRDTVLSQHSIENIGPLRAVLRQAQLVVRINPWYSGTIREVAEVLDRGADAIMLPMFREAVEVQRLCRLVRGRATVLPLVETAAATKCLKNVLACEEVRDIHVGLNDLHLDLGLRFMFEPLANGLLDEIAAACRAAHKPFGIGGVATLGTGTVPAELVLAEHARLGSTGAILARSFHQRATTLAELQARVDFAGELQKLRHEYTRLLTRTAQQIEKDRLVFCQKVTAA